MKKREQALKGVNIGGWLVLEQWIAPQVFDGLSATNEYQLARTVEGKKRIRRHHASFITADDLDWIKQEDISLVRLPVGHWIFGDAPPYIGSVDRLDWFMEETKKRNIQVLIDLHGAPGAQNVYEHSGSGNLRATSDWLRNREKQDTTLLILERIARRYRGYSNLWGIELINEPYPGYTGLRLAWFYRRAYKRLSKILPAYVRIVFSDGYAPWLLMNALGWPFKKSNPILMDVHMYQCFGRRNRRRSFTSHLSIAKRRGKLLGWMSAFQPYMIGEWSAVLPYRLDKANSTKFYNAQLQAYNSAHVLCYWNYKTGNQGNWNYKWLVDSGKLIQ